VGGGGSWGPPKTKKITKRGLGGPPNHPRNIFFPTIFKVLLF